MSVSLDTWHAVIAFPLKPQSSESNDRVEEWGYAELEWYVEGRQGLTGALRALFWPTEGVVEVGRHTEVWAARTPQPPAELFTFQLSPEGATRLRRYLRSTMAADEPIAVSGSSRFYPATRRYHLFHTCHQYAAAALREAGLPVSPWWAFSRGALAWQLDRAVAHAAKTGMASVQRFQ